MLLCFLLGLFELQEIVCLTKHGATLSSLNISRYDDFSLMLKTEESISEIDSPPHFARRVRAVIV